MKKNSVKTLKAHPATFLMSALIYADQFAENRYKDFRKASDLYNLEHPIVFPKTVATSTQKDMLKLVNTMTGQGIPMQDEPNYQVANQAMMELVRDIRFRFFNQALQNEKIAALVQNAFSALVLEDEMILELSSTGSTPDTNQKLTALDYFQHWLTPKAVEKFKKNQVNLPPSALFDKDYIIKFLEFLVPTQEKIDVQQSA